MSAWPVVMLLAFLAGACVLAGAAVRKLSAFARSLPDPAWKPTGIRQLHTGYDESKALQASKDASRRVARRRKVEAGHRPTRQARRPKPVDQIRRVS